jgi:hypothetical protein
MAVTTTAAAAAVTVTLTIAATITNPAQNLWATGTPCFWNSCALTPLFLCRRLHLGFTMKGP